MPKYLESQFTRGKHPDGAQGAWWSAPKGKAHEAVTPLLAALQHEQGRRDFVNKVCLSLFLGHSVQGTTGNKYAQRDALSGQLRLNVARTVAAAANAKIAKNKVRILYMTEGGDWQQQTRARRMTKVVNGTFHSARLYEEMPRAQLDSCVFDLGAVYFYREGKKVCCERVPGTELRVDSTDARYGRPTQLHREMTVPRDALLARYPKHKKLIDEAPRTDQAAFSQGRWVADAIEVRASWKLPSRPGAADGRYVVTLAGADLEDAVYERDYFPFVFLVWEPSPFGFYGQSVCSQLIGIQHSVTKTADDIQEHCDLSTGFVAIEAGSNVSKASFTNEIMKLIEFSDTPPAIIAPPAFQPEKLQWLQFLLQRAPQDVGMSELSVTSRKPAGLDSGKALREFNDLESERFQMVQQRYEQAFVDAANIITDLYEDIYEAEGNFDLRAQGHKLIETIDWEKARMDAEDYVVRPVPTSFLPSTPAAKLQTIQEMAQAGFLSREEALLLLDYPDLESVNNSRNAAYLNILWRIETMLDPDASPRDLRTAVQPVPMTHTLLARQLALSAYHDAESKGAPDDVLENVRRFLSRLDEQERAAQAAPAPAPAPPAAPEMTPDAPIPAPPMQ